MKRIFYFFLFIGLTSCVPKTEFELLETEYQILQLENKNLEAELDSVKNALRFANIRHEIRLQEEREKEIEKNTKKYVSESEAIGYLKDYYEFYNTDQRYRNWKLRRTDSNAFTISLEEANAKFSDDDFFWNAAVYNLVVNNNNTYKVTRSF